MHSWNPGGPRRADLDTGGGTIPDLTLRSESDKYHLVLWIDRQTDYAVRCVLYLSCNRGRNVPVSELAREMGTPPSLTAKVMQRLQHAGLVVSRRGVGGGFALKSLPSEVSLLDVVEAMEGSVALNRCVREPEICPRVDYCTLHPVWCRLSQVLERELAHIDFGALARARRARLE